jgi:uncharacterized protein YlxW (UPF0749 family)
MIHQLTSVLIFTFSSDEQTKMGVAHATEVNDLKAELSKLKEERDAEVERLKKENSTLEEKAKGYQQFGQDKEKALVNTSDALRALKRKADAWLTELTRIHHAFASKFLLPE